MPEGIFGFHNWWMLLASSGQRPEMLLNIQECMGQPPARELSGPKFQTKSAVEKPCFKPILWDLQQRTSLPLPGDSRRGL